MISLPGDEAQATDAKAQANTADLPPPPLPPEPPLPGDESQATAANLPPSPLSPKPETNPSLQENRNTMSLLPGDEAQAKATDATAQATADLPSPPLPPKPETNPFLQENAMSSFPGDEAQATDAKDQATAVLSRPPFPPEPPLPSDEAQATAADIPPSPLPPKPETNPFLQENTMSSPAGDAQATDAKAEATDTDLPLPPLPPKPPLPPRMYVLVSRDKTRLSIPLRAALLSYKIKNDGSGKSETSCTFDTFTLVKIITYMILHSGCNEDGKPVKMNIDALKEWDHSVFLNESLNVLSIMLKAALWLQIPGMVHLIETKLALADHN